MQAIEQQLYETKWQCLHNVITHVHHIILSYRRGGPI